MDRTVRLSLILTAGALMTSVGLAACSNGTQALPGAASEMPANPTGILAHPGAASASPVNSTGIRVRPAMNPANCTPSVWASSLATNSVYGYTGSSTTPCVTLTGPYNGVSFNAPTTVAISRHPQRLYVADLNNNRIVVFNYHGGFIKAFSTVYGGQPYQPWGVCVSPHGLVGVANRQYNNYGPVGNVLFFKPNTPNNGTASGDASGIFNGDLFCAFDRVGNFFVDGTVSSGEKVAYVPRGKVNLPAQSLVDSGVGNQSWLGMYSRINNPADDTLSVTTGTNISTETIMNWKVSGPAAGPLSFSPLASDVLTGYPGALDSVYQAAPTTGGSSGTVYVADYGGSVINGAPANGGPTSVYNTLSAATGVATRPSGQY